MNIATGDAKHLLSDTLRFTETGARLLSSSWLPNGPGAATEQGPRQDIEREGAAAKAPQLSSEALESKGENEQQK
jgi:hypothetical protein